MEHIRALIYIIGVGFCVARSTEMGNAKASKSGTGDKYRLPRFSVYIIRVFTQIRASL